MYSLYTPRSKKVVGSKKEEKKPLMLEVAEIKALVIYLFTYEIFKIGYKKGLWQLNVFLFYFIDAIVFNYHQIQL